MLCDEFLNTVMAALPGGTNPPVVLQMGQQEWPITTVTADHAAVRLHACEPVATLRDKNEAIQAAFAAAGMINPPSAEDQAALWLTAARTELKYAAALMAGGKVDRARLNLESALNSLKDAIAKLGPGAPA